jgi:hydrogenase expression/formation protein HypC|uniref:HypC/HybG/HupF family hydrogenase formation chaperone n=1 Tax=Thermomicrobium roseum TaxID=500 RepID=A0A7C1X1J0_THERO
MCLAIPGQIVALEPETHLALVDVLGVRRRVNVDLVWDEGLAEGDWVLIHVGFALSKVSEQEAAAQLRLLQALGEDEQAMEEVQGYLFDVSE